MRKKKITNILDKLGMDMSLNGYTYWQKAIEIASKNMFYKPSEYNTMLLYKEIAEDFDSTSVRVERAMRYARQRIYKLEEKMGVDYKVRNTNFLAYLVKESKK